MKWQDSQQYFLADGSLRDLIIRDIDESNWNRFLVEVHELNIELSFFHGGKVISLPATYSAIIKLQESDPTTLSMNIGAGVIVNCHFFIEEELEFDIDPKQIKCDATYNSLLEFIRRLKVIFERDVLLTEEGDSDAILIQF